MSLLAVISPSLCLKLTASKKENSSLKEDIHSLEKHIASLEGKLQISESNYTMLLQRVSALAPPTSSDPFLKLIKQARQDYVQLPPVNRENYSGIFYWECKEWTSENQSSHGTLTFTQFRLCDNFWKANVFATWHYPQWVDRPGGRKVTGTTGKSTDIKEEDVILHPWPPQLPAGSKCTHSIAISPNVVASPSAPLQKRKKDLDGRVPLSRHLSFTVGMTEHAMQASTMVLVSAPDSESPLLPAINFNFSTMLNNHDPTFDPDEQTITSEYPVNIGNDLPQALACSQAEMDDSTAAVTVGLEARKGKEPMTPSAGQISLPWHVQRPLLTSTSTSSSANSSTTDLIAHMANTTVQDPQDIIVPATAKGRLAFMQHLSKSIHSSIASTNSNTALGSEKTNKSTTHANPNGNNSQFESYWRKLPAAQKEEYNAKVNTVKLARTSGLSKAGPSKSMVHEHAEVVDEHTRLGNKEVTVATTTN
ncbi:hypothetical protein PAXINDRAFT_155324 [Paxillus involutus ATCC 200175]|uniref:Uncharacterized protein n=1 Tax=Paxillus involutus ATCC 200175 TaxID=664439 RepID=A0A0C9TZC4_PAXIN|nr:hypothetical protein PAXINDRAFT_155324 [Paxillus involutus ATCC 200175]